MATFDLRVGGTDAPAALAGNGRAPVVLENTVDFAATNRDSADVLQLFNVPAGCFVQQVLVDVQTAEGDSLTADIGDGDDADGYHDGVNLNSVAVTPLNLALTEGTPNTVARFTNGKYYSAAGVISMLLNNAADAGKVRVIVVMLPIDI